MVKGGELLSVSITFIQPLSPSPPIHFPSPPSFSHSGVVKGGELLSVSITFIQPLSPSPPILFPSPPSFSPSPPMLFPSPPSFSHSGVVKGGELLSMSITFIQPSIISVVIVSVPEFLSNYIYLVTPLYGCALSEVTIANIQLL